MTARRHSLELVTEYEHVRVYFHQRLRVRVDRVYMRRQLLARHGQVRNELQRSRS